MTERQKTRPRKTRAQAKGTLTEAKRGGPFSEPVFRGERHSGWTFPAQVTALLPGIPPTSNSQGQSGRPSRCWGQGEGGGPGCGRGSWDVTTHKRTVEAAKKATSRRPAREERMEVMTIMSPLRRPGHVSMELGDFPAHTAAAQRLPLNPMAVTSPNPCSHPRPGCLLFPDSTPEPRPPVHLRQASVPCQPGPPMAPASTLFSCSRLFPPMCPPTGPPMADRAVAAHVAALYPKAWRSRPLDNKPLPHLSLCSPSPRHPTHWTHWPSHKQFPQPGDSCWLLGALQREASPNLWPRPTGLRLAPALLPHQQCWAWAGSLEEGKAISAHD